MNLLPQPLDQGYHPNKKILLKRTKINIKEANICGSGQVNCHCPIMIQSNAIGLIVIRLNVNVLLLLSKTGTVARLMKQQHLIEMTTLLGTLPTFAQKNINNSLSLFL